MSSPEDDKGAAPPPEDDDEGELIADPAEEAAALRAFAARLRALPEDAPIPDALVQEGMSALVRYYSVKFQLGERWPPFAPDQPMPATAAMIMATAMLRAVKVEIFELGMWQAWSGA